MGYLIGQADGDIDKQGSGRTLIPRLLTGRTADNITHFASPKCLFIYSMLFIVSSYPEGIHQIDTDLGNK